MHDVEPRQVVVDAEDATEAIRRFVVQRDAELVSVTRPHRSAESIATVKKEDTIFLVRIYAA